MLKNAEPYRIPPKGGVSVSSKENVMALGIIIIIILCSTDSSGVIARSTPLLESSHRILWSLQITINLTKGA